MTDEDYDKIIEELEAELKEQAMQYLSDTGQLGERIGELTEVLEATKDKLAKALSALEVGIAKHDGAEKFLKDARTTLAELTGGTDE